MSRPASRRREDARHAARRLLGAALLLLAAACHQGESPSLPRATSRAPQETALSEAGLVFKARSLRVQDGDSFIARLDNGSSRIIRLSGIDAPERSQPEADQSQHNLRRLLDNRDLQVHVAKNDTYGRAVAQVFILAEGGAVDVGLAQVADGMAWFYRRYRQDLPVASADRYADAERAARESMRGLWLAGDPEPPWEFRRRQQAENRSARR